MTPSEQLVAAADLIRDLAAKATPGPWEATQDVHARGKVDDMVWADAIGCYVTEEFTSPHGQRQGNARWIAALSPALAPLLINWLETEAACIAAVGDVQRIVPKLLDNIEPVGEDTAELTVTIDTSGPALAFARAVLWFGGCTPRDLSHRG